MEPANLPGTDLYSFLPRFWRLASVNMLSNIMVPLAGLVDIAFLGHLADIRYLAGVVLGTILFDYLYRVLKFLRSSTIAITAQAAGQEDGPSVILAGLRSGLIALAIGCLILLLQYPLQRMGFFLLSGSPDIEAAGVDYFYARIWGAPAVLLNFTLIGWLLGQEMNLVVLVMSLVGNLSNVFLDYLMIVRWGWESMGAGLATAISQYLALATGLTWALVTLPWQHVPTALDALWDWTALRETLVLKGNILIRFLTLISTYAMFTNISAVLGTNVLAENGLLLQIVLLSQFTVQGIGMTTQALTGSLKGKGTTAQLQPLVMVSIGASLPIALIFALLPILFPQTVFGMLTNHQEISLSIDQFTPWLLPLLTATAIAFMLEGYFIGLKEGAILRNTVLLAFALGFSPLAIAAWYFHNNHLLWLALIGYMSFNMIGLGLQIRGSLSALKSPQPDRLEPQS